MKKWREKKQKRKSGSLRGLRVVDGTHCPPFLSRAANDSGLGVGDDPSGFDVGEDNWSWSPASPDYSPSKPQTKKLGPVGGGSPPTAHDSAAEVGVGDLLLSRFCTLFSQPRAWTGAEHEGGGGDLASGGLHERGDVFWDGPGLGLGRKGKTVGANSYSSSALMVSF